MGARRLTRIYMCKHMGGKVPGFCDKESRRYVHSTIGCKLYSRLSEPAFVLLEYFFLNQTLPQSYFWMMNSNQSLCFRLLLILALIPALVSPYSHREQKPKECIISGRKMQITVYWRIGVKLSLATLHNASSRAAFWRPNEPQSFDGVVLHS